jgi:hypothetical protein
MYRHGGGDEMARTQGIDAAELRVTEVACQAEEKRQCPTSS